jgi:L-serine dehydratase
LVWRNELALRSSEEVQARLEKIWSAMVACVESGLATEGTLPGYLKVERRASKMTRGLWDRAAASESAAGDQSMEWLQAYAIAVNEENAAGNRVVTAPTNGAAGIIPAVGYYAREFRGVSDETLARDYLLTAAAIGSLYKRNASISGAEAGCQGEVGSACSMAAGALTAVLGGTPAQVENAAEIAMEHNLGLTCDPVGGFVQMPCIERNAIAAGTAVAASRLALIGDGRHKISLDTVIETMRQTGLDMSSKYKETSMGGLAVNVVEC